MLLAMWHYNPTQQMMSAASARWCGSALTAPSRFVTAGYGGRRLSFVHCRLAAEALYRCCRCPCEQGLRFDARRARCSCCGAVLGSACLGDVGICESEVPGFAQGRLAALHFAIWFFADSDLCRSPPQRAAQLIWTSAKGDEAHRNSPRMPGSMQRNRPLLKAIG